jgi:hypothetical protein
MPLAMTAEAWSQIVRRGGKSGVVGRTGADPDKM